MAVVCWALDVLHWAAAVLSWAAAVVCRAAAALGRTSAVHFGSLFLRLLHSFFVGQLRRTTSRVAVILRRGQHSFGPAQGFCLVAEAEEKFTPGARV